MLITIVGIGLRYPYLNIQEQNAFKKNCILLDIKFDQVIFAYGCDFTILIYFHVPRFI